MKPIQDTLRLITTVGSHHNGRVSIISTQLRFDCSNRKLPISYNLNVSVRDAVLELFSCMHGISNTEAYKKLGLPIDESVAVNTKTARELIDLMLKRDLISEEQIPLVLNNFSDDVLGELGHNHGVLWRSWPKTSQEIHRLAVTRRLTDLPADFVNSLTETYSTMPDEAKKNSSLEAWVLTHYYSAVDQLHELILDLRAGDLRKPYLVTSFNPEFTPIKDFSPGVNVMLGRSAVFNDPFAFQCFLQPPVLEGEPNRLAMKVYLTAADVYNDVPKIAAMYGILLQLLARVTRTCATTLILDIGEAYYQPKDAEKVIAYLTSPSTENFPTIIINNAGEDLFLIDTTDIIVLSHEEEVQNEQVQTEQV